MGGGGGEGTVRGGNNCFSRCTIQIFTAVMLFSMSFLPLTRPTEDLLLFSILLFLIQSPVGEIVP